MPEGPKLPASARGRHQNPYKRVTEGGWCGMRGGDAGDGAGLDAGSDA